MRYLGFFGLGAAFGYLYFQWMRVSAPSLPNMFLRLFAYTTMLYLLITRFGAPAGAAVLVGVLVSRLLVRTLVAR